MADVLEQGNIYFLYLPAEGETSVDGLEDVARFFVVLKPEEKENFRSLIVGQKKLPDPTEAQRPGEEGRRYWGFVDRVVEDAHEIRDTFRLTGAQPPQAAPPARPVGEGVYAIVRHENHTALAYALELPETPGPAQDALHIRKRAAYILSIKNPETHAPRGYGLDEERKAEFPEELQSRFGDHRWVNADPPEFLDYEGAEFLFIATDKDPIDDLGIDLTPERKSPETAGILQDLGIQRTDRLLEPLLQGTWQ